MMLLDERSANIVDRQVREGSPEPKAEELEAARSWHPVNRRRMLNRGWHLDIGAGFSTDAQRTPDGHPYQGVIILVFLSDCVPGGGRYGVHQGFTQVDRVAFALKGRHHSPRFELMGY